MHTNPSSPNHPNPHLVSQNRRTPKKEEANLWKHDKYEEIVMKEGSKGSNKPAASAQPRRASERSSKPSTETTAPPRTASTSKPPAVAVPVVQKAREKDDSPETPDPVQAYLKNVKKGPAPNYSTARSDKPTSSTQSRPQDSRSTFASRGPPTHPIESNSTPVANRQSREPGSASKHASASPASKITYSQTAPTAPGSVEKSQQQGQSSRGPASGYTSHGQRPSESSAARSATHAQPSYRSALEAQPQHHAPSAAGATITRTIPATAPVFVPASPPPVQHQQVHVTLNGAPHVSQSQPHGAPPRIEQTVRMTPIKAPPGLDTSLNPSAREFQPTDDSPTPSSASSTRRGPQGQGASACDYPAIVRPTGQNGPYLEPQHPAQPVVQQVSYRPAGGAAGVTGPASHASYPNQSQGHPGHGGQYQMHQQNPQGGAAHSEYDYRPRRDASRSHVSPSHSEADLYGHNMAHMAHPHSAAHPSMMYRGAQGGYNMPMNMPVYDQMVYMDPRVQYMPDGTVWYANVPVPGPVDGAPVGGGTVYYPLPPTPGNE